MLSGATNRLTTRRGLKALLWYAEVASGKRDEGLPEPEVIPMLQKTPKKRQESALLRQGNTRERQNRQETPKTPVTITVHASPDLPSTNWSDEAGLLTWFQQEIAKSPTPQTQVRWGK